MTEALVRVNPQTDPGITRIPEGTGFRYEMPDGSAPSASDLKRIHALVIPPAWTDVWICTNPDGHIQVIGVDGAGRHQYRYHPDWQHHRAEVKWERMLHLAQALPHARAHVTRDLGQSDDARARTLATAFRFLDEASPRVGSTEYLEKYGSRGLTTLLRRNAAVDGHRVTLSFPAKEHTHDLLHMTDGQLAAVVEELVDGSPDGVLLSYAHGSGRSDLTPTEVNDYIRVVTGEHFSAKDFRTIRGTIAAARTLAKIGVVTTTKARHEAEVEAVKAASEALQNTPAVAKSSYVDPRIFTQYGLGRTLDLDISEDTALRRLLLE